LAASEKADDDQQITVHAKVENRSESLQPACSVSSVVWSKQIGVFFDPFKSSVKLSLESVTLSESDTIKPDYAFE
jgi:hypothetical protein